MRDCSPRTCPTTSPASRTSSCRACRAPAGCSPPTISIRRRRRTAPPSASSIRRVPLAPLFGTKGARFDPLKFNWLGRMDRSDGPCTVWHTSPVKTWADMLERPVHRRLVRRRLADGHLSGDAEQAVRHQDQGDRRLQGRRLDLPGDGERRDRRPLRPAAHRDPVAAPAMAHRAQDHDPDPDQREAQPRVPRCAERSWSLPRTSRPASSSSC